MRRIRSFFFAILVIVTIDQITAPKPRSRPEIKETIDPIVERSDAVKLPRNSIDEMHGREQQQNADISPGGPRYSSAEFRESSRSVVENLKISDKPLDNFFDHLPKFRPWEIRNLDVEKSPKTEIITQKLDEVLDGSHSSAITSKTVPKKNTEESLRSANDNAGSSTSNENTVHSRDKIILSKIDTSKINVVEVHDKMGNKYSCETGYLKTDFGIMKFVEFSDEIELQFVRSGKELLTLYFEDGSPFSWDIGRSQFFDMKKEREAVYLFDESDLPVLCRVVYEKTEKGVRKLIELSDEAQKRFLAAGKYEVTLHYSDGQLSYWDLTTSRYYNKEPKDDQNVADASKSRKISEKTNFSIKNYLLEKKAKSQPTSTNEYHLSVSKNSGSSSYKRKNEFDDLEIKSSMNEPNSKVQKITDSEVSSTSTIGESVSSIHNIEAPGTEESIVQLNEYRKIILYDKDEHPVYSYLRFIDTPIGHIPDYVISDSTQLYYIRIGLKKLMLHDKRGSIYEWDLKKSAYYELHGQSEFVYLYDRFGNAVLCRTVYRKVGHVVQQLFELSDAAQRQLIKLGENPVFLAHPDGRVFEMNIRSSYFYKLLDEMKILGSS